MRSFFLFILLVLTFGVNNYAQKVTFSPNKPIPGDKISIKLDPSGSVLADADKVEFYAYLYNKDLTDTKGSDMKKEGKFWTASFTINKENYGALVIFKSDDIQLNNDKKGYAVHLYNKKGEALPGTYAGLGYGYFNWTSYYLDFDRDPDLAYQLMKKDFEKNPAIKKDFVQYYIPVYSTYEKEKAPDIIKEGISLLESKNNLSDDEYSFLINSYSKLKDTLNVNKFEKIALEKYPLGIVAQQKEASEIQVITDNEMKRAAVEEFGSKYPESRFLPGLHNSVIKKYLESEDYTKLTAFLTKNKNNIDAYYFQNTALKIVESGGDLNNALVIASEGVDKVTTDQKSEKKPEYLTEKQWKESKNENLGQSLYSQGRILYDLNKKNEALVVLKKAAEKTNFKEAAINLYYSKVLMDTEKFGEAFDNISRFVREGNSTAEMNDLLESAYVKMKGNTNGFDLFINGLKKEAGKKLEAKLKREMINEPAPDFRLTDLDGKEVTLNQFKGRVIVVDFWATWCGPCLSSFPGLKKAVDNFKENNDVKFLFINSWERVQDKRQNAVDFISKNSYPFHVLLDMDNKVIETYKVSGIPTKFVIDKNGNVRFKSVGYSGNNDKMVTEIETMISMLNN